MANPDKANRIKYSQKDAAKDVRLSLSVPKSLTRKQERELFKKIAAGDKKAINRLVSANLWLVGRVAEKYKDNDHYLSYKVLVELGKSGLRKAVDKYDPGKEYKFSTYALWWIRQAIHLALGIKEIRGGSSKQSTWL